MGGDGTRDAGAMLAELRAARAAILERLATMDRVTTEAAQLVYYGESADRSVVTNVDGNGRLLALEVDPGAVRAAHPERIGPEVVAAVAAARAAAAEEKARQVRERLATG